MRLFGLSVLFFPINEPLTKGVNEVSEIKRDVIPKLDLTETVVG